MSISDAQFTAWLAADNRERVVLIEVQAYSGGGVVTRYLSNRGFTSWPTDTPANTAYEEILIGVPGIRSAMADALRGRSVVSYGDLDVDNSGGVRDGWLLDGWDGRPVVILMGDPSWPKADFRQVFAGVIDDISARDTRTLTLKLRDRQHLLDVPLQVNRVGGTGPAKDQRLPVCYGQVFNIEPVLVDAAARKYQWHDGQVQSVDAVYQDGATIATYTANLADGTITLTAAATGRITLDGKGSKTGGTYVDKTGDIVSRLVQERAGWSGGDIDAASITALNTDVPGAVGLYITADATTVLSALDTLITGAGGYYSITRAGKLRVGQFKAPAGTPVLTITDDDVQFGRIELVRRLVPMQSARVGYARFFTTIDSGAAAGLTEAQRQRLRDPYLVAIATSAPAGFLMAVDGDLQPSCFVAGADAGTEATRRAALWGQLRRVFRLTGFLAAQQVQLGDVVALELSRHGLTGGALATVVGLRESITGGSLELEVFL